MYYTLTDETKTALAADISRLLPEHDSPFNHGWLARAHGLPILPPAECVQPEGWELGWQTADETPSEHWGWVKSKLCSPMEPAN